MWEFTLMESMNGQLCYEITEHRGVIFCKFRFCREVFDCDFSLAIGPNNNFRGSPQTLHAHTGLLLYNGRQLWSSSFFASCCVMQVSEKSGTNVNFIYYLHYMLYKFTPTLYGFSQPLYHVCADFAEHIGIDSSTAGCNSLSKVTKISDFNSIHHP
jgi:hypothetical protein